MAADARGAKAQSSQQDREPAKGFSALAQTNRLMFSFTLSHIIDALTPLSASPSTTSIDARRLHAAACRTDSKEIDPV